MTSDRTDDVSRRLDLAVRSYRARAALVRLAVTTTRQLRATPSAHLAWSTVPLDLYDNLPPEIASSWVFVLRANSTSGAERHPNSIQRFMSLDNEGDMQTWTGTEWQSHVLRTGDDAPFDTRWLTIPLNVWHRPVMGARNWTVVSFHTAGTAELVEERAADDENPDAGTKTSERYAGRHAR
jgi:hypothetical protein